MSDFDLSRPVLERLREAADVVAVVGEVVTLRKAGRNFVGLCPFHGERTPSFSVSREKGTYYCFGCKRGGDVIDFVMETERLTFPEAVERLANRFAVELPLATPGARRRRDEGDALREVLEAAQTFYARHVTDDRPRAFLERRGVTPDVAIGFGLGYAPAAWRGLLDALGGRFPERLLIASGLLVEGEGGRRWDRFRDRVTIPIRLARGQLVGFGGRIIGDEQPKYLNSPETALFAKSRVLFGLDRATQAFGEGDRAVLVEGYFDCIAMHVAGFTETVATLGTALTEHHARELARRVGKVVVCYDGDAAGRAAAVTAVRTLLATNLEIAVLLLPEGCDPDDIARREGRAGVAERIEQALDAPAFLVSLLGANRTERRSRLLSVLEIADACADPVRRFSLREALAHAADVPLAALAGSSAAPANVATLGPETVLYGSSPGAWAVIRAALLDLPVDARAPFVLGIPADIIEDAAARAVFELLAARARAGEPIELAPTLSACEDRDLRRALAALEHEIAPLEPQRLKETVENLARRRLDRRIAELRAEIERTRAAGDEQACARLLAEQSELIKRKKRP